MKPKKHLGQNFLRDKNILTKIIKAANLKPEDVVIEIGPGEGALTEELVKYPQKVIAIEVDRELASILKEKFRNYGNLEIINEDILKVNLPELLSHHSAPAKREKNLKKVLRSTYSQAQDDDFLIDQNRNDGIYYKIIANIPYYITSPIIQLFLETKYPPKEMILMVQHEVAKRICAKPGDMSILAVSVQYYAQPELLFSVSKNAFYPVPKVDSAIIRITHNAGHITPEEKKQFFRTVKAGFAAKRKTLLNNLANGFHLDKQEAEKRIKKAGIDPAIRPQELGVGDWKKLSQLF